MPGAGIVKHKVITPHGTYGGGEEAARAVGVDFSRVKDRFFANYPFPVYYFGMIQGIEDLPVPGQQLHGILALVLDGDMIAEGKMLLVVLEEGAFKTASNGDLYAFGYLGIHNSNTSGHCLIKRVKFQWLLKLQK